MNIKTWLLATALISPSLNAYAELKVSVAISLKEAFQEINNAFHQKHSEKITMNSAGSGTLLQQIVQGAPADVLVTADQQTMDKAQQAQAIVPNSRTTFAHNDLVLIQAKNQNNIKKLSDLTQSQIEHIAIGNPNSVPAGRYAQLALQQAKLFATLRPKLVYDGNVRAVLEHVARAEAEAGFVYRTDALLLKDKVRMVCAVALPEAVSYAIAITADSTHPKQAQAYVAFVRSPMGAEILKKYGFTPTKP